MSIEDGASDVLQKKADVVHWHEYEALRDHLKFKINQAVEPLSSDLQKVEMKVDEAIDTAHTTQGHMTTMQQNLAELTQAVAALRVIVERQQEQDQQEDEEDGSVNNGGAAQDVRGQQHHHARRPNAPMGFGHGGGRGDGGRGNGRVRRELDRRAHV